MKTTTKISEQPSPLNEPQVNLTVFVKGGGKAKALDFTGMQYNCNTLAILLQSYSLICKYFYMHDLFIWHFWLFEK